MIWIRWRLNSANLSLICTFLRNVNDKLTDKLVVLERKCHASEQYSRRECLKISGISAEVGDKDMEKKVLEGLDVIDAPVNKDLVEDCHGIPSKGSPKKVILKLSRRKDSRRVLLNKEKLKQLKPESLNLPTGVKTYINGILCPYYKTLWTRCRKLWDAKRILSFWVSNGSIRVKLINENVFIITHDMTVIWRSFSLVIHWLQIPIRFYIDWYV